MDKYVGCMLELDYDSITLNFAQPVVIQIVEDEFDLPNGNSPKTHTPSRDILMNGNTEEVMSEEDKKV